ncbi:AlpA family transcriptional regulator [Vibrio parahaemolyticus]|nr:AlpA family transcriptional regulator [Vibrio parahaemolyticus]EGQ8400063.1 AlpA family phage regulatory protein [Vibrio parahaemolyticus]EGQ9048491.1 AlpA family transcriptional regulator [Vibrio parahaemolyticus]EGQ9587433.1 AlpA family transcriptional regulator [Vibrio parahaemolyticus]EGR0999109.1 AlpA family transcriptional regulator [Vibrio parahaemolyticus]
MEKTELSRSAIYRKMNDDAFPKSVNLGDRAVAWVESEVDYWVESILLTRGCEGSQLLGFELFMNIYHSGE